MSLTSAEPNELIWRGIAALGQFHTVFSLVFMSQCFSSCPQTAPCHVFNTCLSTSRLRVATVASTVQRQTLDNKWRWQPIRCQLWRAVMRPSLRAQTLTSTLVLLLYSVIPWQRCSAHSCAFDVASWVKCGWHGHKWKSVLEINDAPCVGFHYTDLMVYLQDLCNSMAQRTDSTY